MTDSETNPWREAIINELVTAHVLVEEHEKEPEKALNDAIMWNIQTALDPRVSHSAKRLMTVTYNPYMGEAGDAYLRHVGGNLPLPKDFNWSDCLSWILGQRTDLPMEICDSRLEGTKSVCLKESEAQSIADAAAALDKMGRKELAVKLMRIHDKIPESCTHTPDTIKCGWCGMNNESN